MAKAKATSEPGAVDIYAERPPTEFIHSGSTLLNLALTGHPDKGWPLGRMSNIIGDRSSGKSLLAIEAATMFVGVPPKGLKPKVCYVECESGFSKDYAASLGMPVDHCEFRRVETVEQLHDLLMKVADESKADEATLFVLDSLDALTSSAELELAIDKPTFAMTKQKKLNEMFRRLIRKIEEKNIHFMIISQVRENIDGGLYSPKFTRAGGKSLDFYATHTLWLAERGKISSSSTNIPYGINCEARLSKNKVSAPFRSVMFPILFGIGTDDIWSMIDFLSKPPFDKSKYPPEVVELMIDQSVGWYILNKGEEKKYRIADLITHIESDPAVYRNVKERCARMWDLMEEHTKPVRANKLDLMNAVEPVKSKETPKKKGEKEDKESE